MFDKNKFKAHLLLSGRELKDVAKLLKINLATLYRKMNGDSDFYRNEIQLICEFLGIEDKKREEIFFAKDVT